MSSSFLTERIVDMRRPPVSEILGQTNFVRAITPIFNRYSLVAPAIRVQLTLIGSPLRAIQ